MGGFDFSHTLTEVDLIKLLIGRTVTVEESFIDDDGSGASCSVDLTLGPIRISEIKRLLQEVIPE